MTRCYRIRLSPRRRLRSLWQVQKKSRRRVRILWRGKPPAALLPSASLQEGGGQAMTPSLGGAGGEP